jgi:hypothetical protein
MEHATPDRARQKVTKISVVEAAIVSAGFEYRSVRSYGICAGTTQRGFAGTTGDAFDQYSE